MEYTINASLQSVSPIAPDDEYWDEKLKVKEGMQTRIPIHMPRIVSIPKGIVVNPETRKIGWIGTGSSGKNMAYQLVRQGYDVTVSDLVKERTDYLVEEGAKYEADLTKIAMESDYLFIDVGNHKNLNQLLFDEVSGIARYLKPGSILVNHSPREIKDAMHMLKSLKKQRNVSYLDAPIHPDSGMKTNLLKKQVSIGGD